MMHDMCTNLARLARVATTDCGSLQARQFAARYSKGPSAPRTLQGSHDWTLPVAAHAMMYAPSDLAFVLYLAHRCAQLEFDTNGQRAARGSTQAQLLSSVELEDARVGRDDAMPGVLALTDGLEAGGSSAMPLLDAASETDGALELATPKAQQQVLAQRTAAHMPHDARRFGRAWCKVSFVPMFVSSELIQSGAAHTTAPALLLPLLRAVRACSCRTCVRGKSTQVLRALGPFR